MGWIRARQKSITEAVTPPCDKHEESPDSYPILPKSARDASLPLIPCEIVKTHDGKDGRRLWIVIDGVVYDCTSFVDEHPGGSTVIESFGGAECSWQFWRFHSQNNLQQDARKLRVGRTMGMVNKFAERAAYVGLKAIGDDF